MSNSFDVIIVGAGMAGVSVAAELAGKASVLLLEIEARPGTQATGRSAALYAPGYGGGPIRTLTLASQEFLQQTDTEGRAYLKPRGGLFIATPEQGPAFDALRVSAPGTLHALSAAEVIALVPLLRSDRIAGGLHDPVAADMDVDLLQQTYLRRLRHHGGHISCEEAFVAGVSSAAGWRVKTSQRELTCAVLVNAAGAWADDVALKAGVAPLGLQPKRRTAALIERPADPAFPAWPAVLDVEERFYFKPDAGLLLVSPAEETDVEPHDAQADDLALAEGIERISAVADIQVTRAPRAWAGLRTFAPDRIPVIGPDSAAGGGFHWVAAQGGYGIQTAPAAARLAAAMVGGGPLPDFADRTLLDALAPGRFR